MKVYVVSPLEAPFTDTNLVKLVKAKAVSISLHLREETKLTGLLGACCRQLTLIYRALYFFGSYCFMCVVYWSCREVVTPVQGKKGPYRVFLISPHYNHGYCFCMCIRNKRYPIGYFLFPLNLLYVISLFLFLCMHMYGTEL